MTEKSQIITAHSIGPLLKRKSMHRAVSYQSLHDFFTDELVSEAHRYWDTNLGPFVTELPEYREVLDRLMVLLRELIPDPD